ncbi:MAG: DNA alkylation repair protein [Actinomycetales bacterium]
MTAGDPGDLVATVRDLLARSGDPDRARGQQAYMKSAMPYRGVTMAELRQLIRAPLAARSLNEAEWLLVIARLWDEAEYREERYAATEIAQHNRYRRFAERPERLHLYEHLVRSGAWWDLVDPIAVHGVGGVLRSARAQGDTTVHVTIRSWAHDPDLWVRRTAILSQNRFAAQTDTALLVEAIDASLDDRDFFARKAIGWALREYAKTDPHWVIAFTDARPGMSRLSRREARKHLD